MEDTVHREMVEFLQKKQEVLHCFLSADSREFMCFSFFLVCGQSLVEQCAEWGEKYQADCEANDLELNRLTQERNTNLEKLKALQNRWEHEQETKRIEEVSCYYMLHILMRILIVYNSWRNNVFVN